MLDGAPPGAATLKSTPIFSLVGLVCEKVGRLGLQLYLPKLAARNAHGEIACTVVVSLTESSDITCRNRAVDLVMLPSDH
jgi:hypothetical protein